MPQGLSPSRIVDVMVNFAPVAIPRTNFDTLLIMGDSNVIDTGEAIRTYNALEEVAGDFGTTAPEYYAAALFFSQKPQPATLYIGRWAATATNGSIAGGFLTGTDQLITKWNTVTNGGFKVSIDGSTQTNITGINLSSVTNMNAVASAIQTVLRAIATGGFTQATVVWNG